MKRPLLEAIRERPLLSDGAMGTQLMAAGLGEGQCGGLWNVEHPAEVEKIQRRYVEGGADCLITNTFTACSMGLARHGCADRTEAINKAAVVIARRAFGDGEGYVLGDLGPFGALMEPYGAATESEVRATYAQQARALVEEGADALIIETQTALEEIAIAVEQARAAGALCIIVSLAYDLNQVSGKMHTMMGVSPEKAAEAVASAGVDVIGMNCGTGIDVHRAAEIVERYRAACALPIMAQPNAGKPTVVNGRVIYKETPEEMAGGIGALIEAGAAIVGGCCGTTPDHIAAFRRVLDARQ